MMDPCAYRQFYRTWRHPADKHIPVPVDPPYGYPKFPAVSWRQDWPVMLLVAALLALAAMVRLIEDVLR